MAFIGLHIPEDIAEILASNFVPGDIEESGGMHITILYLNDDVPVLDVAKAMCASYSVVSKTKPFFCNVSEVSSFSGSEDSVPIIYPVVSPGLMSLQSNLRSEFDRLGLPYSKKYGDYKPHVTLSYADNEEFKEFKESKLPTPVVWMVSNMIIWGGNCDDEMLSIDLKFNVSKIEKAASRLVSR